MSHRPRIPEIRYRTYQPRSNDGFETVFTISGYYDGIRTGIASYQGRPHVFDSLFDEDEIGGWGTFWLMPIAPTTFAMAMEDWHIWVRFAQSDPDYSKGRPYALPQDRRRYEEIQPILEPLLELDKSRSIRATGIFNRPAPPHRRSCTSLPVEVLWELYPHPVSRRRI